MTTRLIFLVALAGTALAAVAPAAPAQMPLPKDDPFYAVPMQLGGIPNGTILASRAVDVSAAGIPLRATAWQLKYRSLDAHDQPTAMVTTVMVPKAAWTGGGPRPLVSYQVAEDSADTKCAVSYALSGGFAALATQSNASTETLLIAQALSRGWAVVASDYQGPKASFFAAPEEAHGVLDGIRAALAHAPAGFTAMTPVAMWGYSGGGYATSVAALAQPSYAPELRLAGAAIGAPTASVEAEVVAFSGSIAGGAIAMAIAALDRAYPEVNLTQYLNDTGKRAVAASAHDCLVEAAQRHPFARIEDWEVRPNILDEPALDAFLKSISPQFMPGRPEIPVFLYHDRTDEFAPIAPALDMFAKWCAAGTKTQVHVEPVGEHIAYQTLGAPLAMSYLADRFAGKPVTSTCPPPAAGAAPSLRALRLARLRTDRRGRVALRLRNPNPVAVTVRAIIVRANGSARLLARRTTRARIAAGGTRMFHVAVSRRHVAVSRRRVRVRVRVDAHAQDGRALRGTFKRMLP